MKQKEKGTTLNALFIFEIIVQMAIICYGYRSLAVAIRWWWNTQNVPGDYQIYYWAGKGIFIQGYIYSKWISFIFTPLTWISLVDGFAYWVGIQTISFMFLAHKMFQVKYGWVLVLVVFYSFSTLLMDGNIQLLLMLTCCFPLPSLLGILIKPHYAIFPILHYLAAYFRTIKHLPLKNKLTKWQGLRSSLSWGTTIQYKNFNWYWFGMILICVLCSIPSKESWEFAMTKGQALVRPANLSLLLPAYYILMKKRISS